MGKLLRPGLRILMVDDSPEDTFFVQRALEKSGVGKFFQAVSSVDEAIAYLRGEGKYGDRSQFYFPNVALVDLKMPGKTGFDLLRWLQEHPECKVIPTIIFSSSAMESDIHEGYVLGANAFMTKPHNFDEMVELIQRTYEFWSRCHTPHPPPGERCA